jgi:hypothetical protein
MALRDRHRGAEEAQKEEVDQANKARWCHITETCGNRLDKLKEKKLSAKNVESKRIEIANEPHRARERRF